MRVLMLAATVVLATLAPGRAIDHGLWTKVLAGAVRQGRVDYPKLAHNPDFDRYLQELATADPGAMANEQERLATYLNAYNAFVIKGIVDNWPLTQVTNVAGFFDKKTYPFAGRELTLDQIENTLARAVGDPRVHAALVCGAVGCPDLRAEAYSGA
ncbi:MAG: DUF547 domain-containing protein, partial [Armatimonadetes bacterium]|nr:DUF547 domain-containing protein [Armatimonadota bacterium]